VTAQKRLRQLEAHLSNGKEKSARFEKKIVFCDKTDDFLRGRAEIFSRMP
jgi:hypothetical protein